MRQTNPSYRGCDRHYPKTGTFKTYRREVFVRSALGAADGCSEAAEAPLITPLPPFLWPTYWDPGCSVPPPPKTTTPPYNKALSLVMLMQSVGPNCEAMLCSYHSWANAVVNVVRQENTAVPPTRVTRQPRSSVALNRTSRDPDDERHCDQSLLQVSARSGPTCRCRIVSRDLRQLPKHLITSTLIAKRTSEAQVLRPRPTIAKLVLTYHHAAGVSTLIVVHLPCSRARDRSHRVQGLRDSIQT